MKRKKSYYSFIKHFFIEKGFKIDILNCSPHRLEFRYTGEKIYIKISIVKMKEIWCKPHRTLYLHCFNYALRDITNTYPLRNERFLWALCVDKFIFEDRFFKKYEYDEEKTISGINKYFDELLDPLMNEELDFIIQDKKFLAVQADMVNELTFEYLLKYKGKKAKEKVLQSLNN